MRRLRAKFLDPPNEKGLFSVKPSSMSHRIVNGARPLDMKMDHRMVSSRSPTWNGPTEIVPLGVSRGLGKATARRCYTKPFSLSSL